jgi:general secretion pathway protein K
LSTRERFWLNQTENHKDLATAQTVAFAAFDLARLTLRDDMRNNAVDHLLEPWTIPIPIINVEEGKVSGRLIEMQGRFNLFNLQSEGKASPAGLIVMKSLLASRNLPVDWADKMATVMARQVALGLGNKTDVVRGKIFPIANLAELAELTGIDATQLAVMEPIVTILPEATPVNVNFAPPELLAAVTPGLNVSEAEQIVSQRATKHFNVAQEYTNALPERLRTTAGTSAYTVESQYFLSEVDTWFGRAHLHFQAMLYRQHNKMPEILWIRRL